MKSMRKSKSEKDCHYTDGQEKSITVSGAVESRPELSYLLYEVEELYHQVSLLVDNVPGRELYGKKFKCIREEIEQIKDDLSSQALSSE